MPVQLLVSKNYVCTCVAKTPLSWVSPVYTSGSIWPQEPGFLFVHLATHLYTFPTVSAFLTFPKLQSPPTFAARIYLAWGTIGVAGGDKLYSVTPSSSIFCTLGVLQLEKVCSYRGCCRNIWTVCKSVTPSLPEANPHFFFSLGFCSDPHHPSLACRVKLLFHSGKKLMKILHTEVLRA